jgi:hypothetical protein
MIINTFYICMFVENALILITKERVWNNNNHIKKKKIKEGKESLNTFHTHTCKCLFVCSVKILLSSEISILHPLHIDPPFECSSHQ